MAEFTEVSVEDDGDGHTYVIPVELSARFNELQENGDDDDYEQFNDEFGKYSLGGALSNINMFVRSDYFDTL